MTAEQLREAIRQRSADGKIACKALLELAKASAAEPREIGRLCDEMGIRISACQLGCFK